MRQSLIKKNSRLREALISPLPFLEINMTSILASCMGIGIVWPVWIPRCMGSRLSWNNNTASWKFLKPFWIGINCPLIQKNSQKLWKTVSWGFTQFPCVLLSSPSNSFTELNLKLYAWVLLRHSVDCKALHLDWVQVIFGLCKYCTHTKFLGQTKNSAVSEIKKECFVLCLNPGFAKKDIRLTLLALVTCSLGGDLNFNHAK